ncbi:uncharacterized protein MAM_04104 [Metarhizium album ARSEF 1941]|uniref:Integral membrane protein n=1 Tax=Metarhizium album (strain ARSEF 1941) TaxID=1081103 RepID=A0A0B2WWB9_METAS|nr:uncharacterized protein MAM_04104 [Metarhizium album ARSEF 1941]KHN98343.1 integral membrane protein [Metarhizium album ARSEF 1941]
MMRAIASVLTREAVLAAGLIAGLFSLQAAPVDAATASQCPVPGQICFQWAVPEAAASSGSGSVYLQMRAPTSYEWVGLGIGSRMNGADMFVMYTDGAGNVTLSTRRGLGHVMPLYSPKAGVELLAGSGEMDGQMVANVKCNSCSRLTLGSSNAWLSAWKQGTGLASTKPDAQIDYHDGNAVFSVDFSKATIPSDQNPFASGDGNGGNATSAPGGDGHGVAVVQGDPVRTLLYAHGIIMSAVFVLGYPIGAMLMPLLGRWAMHAGWQLVTFMAMWAGVGVGYVLSRRTDLQCHSQLGIILACLVSLQPLLGYLHHRHYLKSKQRGIVSHFHIWYGRLLIILGVIDGGLGLQLAGNDYTFVVTYCVLVAVVAAAYVAVVLFKMRRTRRAGVPRGSPGNAKIPGAGSATT